MTRNVEPAQALHCGLGSDFVGFARYASFPHYFNTPKRTTRAGGLETYRQLHALYTGALPSEVL